MTPTDTLNDAFGRLNVEVAAFTDGHASPVDSGLLPRWNDGLHHVARGEPVNAFTQESTRFEMRFEPPRAFGTT